MNNTLTKKEREHLGVIKAMPCAVCGAEGGSEAHHIEQQVFVSEQWQKVDVFLASEKGRTAAALFVE